MYASFPLRPRLGLAVVPALAVLAFFASGCVTHHHHRVVEQHRNDGARLRMTFDRELNSYTVDGRPGYYYHRGHFYRFHAEFWHRSARIDGPWVSAKAAGLPPGLDAHHRRRVREASHERRWDRHEQRSERREDRKEHRTEAHDDRKEHRAEVRDDRKERRDEHRGEVQEDRDERRDGRHERRDAKQERRAGQREETREARDERDSSRKKSRHGRWRLPANAADDHEEDDD